MCPLYISWTNLIYHKVFCHLWHSPPIPRMRVWCCCPVLSHILLATPFLQLNTDQGPTPLSHHLVQCVTVKDKETIALVFQFNTGLPLKTLVVCWGPYCLLCSYAAVENVMFIPPKYRMVRQCHLRTQTMRFSSLSSLCLYATMPIYSLLGSLVKTSIKSGPFLQSILFIYCKHSDITGITALIKQKLRRPGIFFFSS